jgi:alkylhydroperoxidase family enzyme
LSDLAILHATTLAAFFNYLNRVADAVGIEFDYASALPRMVTDGARPPIERPPVPEWPTRPAFGDLTVQFGARPRTAEAFGRWRRHVLEGQGPLEQPRRLVIARAVALELCDTTTAEALAHASPRGRQEECLVEYAGRLTTTPWRLGASDLQPLRALGLGDRELFDVISVAAFQNTASRLMLALGESVMGRFGA